MKSLYMLLLCCLILTACSSNSTTSSSEQTHEHIPTLNVGLEVSDNSAIVTLDTDIMIMKERVGQARKIGEGHGHMYLDDGEKQTIKEKITTIPNLAAGKHVLRVSLHNNDHTPYGVSKTIEFEIK